MTRIAALLDRSPQLAARVTYMLKHWGPVAAPAAETVARRLVDLDARPWRDGLPAWTVRDSQDPPGLHPYIEVLAGLGDERALPLLLTALKLPRRPEDTGYRLARYTGHADRITAAILPRFPMPVVGDPAPREWYAFQVALRAFGPAAAPAVPLLLAAPLRPWTAATLGRIGPAAIPALPALRAAATSDDPRMAVAAAGALWRIDRSSAALPVLAAHLDGPAAREAWEEIAGMGSAAAPVVPLIARHLVAPQGEWWPPVRAAVALWHVTGDAERVAPVLTAAWHGNPYTRIAVAEAATGALATVLEPLFRAETTSNRRSNVADNGWSSSQVIDDERLLGLCRDLT